ncbi:unnamed protein product [Rhizoctonia solani]|uniref:Uncharacterized protein n=1 Tax=Rhizoctonia solani TaxID=456999 RepID=A0A8H3D445_9AGAM|nr:unnamed protein product [Rhizoctonia solani]
MEAEVEAVVAAILEVVRVSAAARPFFLVLAALALVWLFTPSFPSRAGSPFRPTSPTKSAASGTGSFILGSHRSGAAYQIFGGLKIIGATKGAKLHAAGPASLSQRDGAK